MWPSRRISPRVAAAVLLLAAQIAGVVWLVLAPARTTLFTYQWQPTGWSQRVPLRLVDPYVERLAVGGSCTDLLRANAVTLYASYRGAGPEGGGDLLVVIGRSGNLYVEVRDMDGRLVGGSGPVATSAAQDGSCRWSVDYRRLGERAEWAVSAGDDGQGNPLPRSARLAVNNAEYGGSAPSAFQVSVGTRPLYAYQLSEWRPVVTAGVLAAFPLFLLLSGALRPRRGSRQRQPRRTRTVTPVDLAVVAAGMVAAFIAAPVYDDGWVLARARLLIDTGWTPTSALTDPFNYGIPNPQGFLYESLLGFTSAQSTWLPATRLLSIVLVAVTYVVASRWLIPLVGGRPRTSMTDAVAALVAVATLLAWGGTLRVENAISLLTVLAIALGALVLSREGARTWGVGCLTLVAGTAMATHQTGLLTLGVSATFCLAALIRGPRRVLLVASMVSGSLAATALLLVNQNAAILRATLADYSRLRGSETALTELDRIHHFMAVANPAQRTFLVIAAALVIAAVAVGIRQALWGGWDVAGISGMAALAGLVCMTFTASKWGWHLAVWAAPAYVGAAVIQHARWRVTDLTRIGAVVVGVAAAAGVGWVAQPLWTQGRLVTTLTGAAIVALTVGIIVLFRRRRDASTPLLPALMSVALVGILMQVMIVGVFASIVRPWSYLDEAGISASRSDARCGVPTALLPSTSGISDQRLATSPFLQMYALCNPGLRIDGGAFADVHLQMGSSWPSLTGFAGEGRKLLGCQPIVSLLSTQGNDLSLICLYQFDRTVGPEATVTSATA